MFFTVSLYSALIIFGLGLAYKISTWFRWSINPEAKKFSTLKRLGAFVKGFFLTIFSKKIFILLRVLVLDILLQIKILKEDFLRWLMHICIFSGFMLLLLMHALDYFITASLFSDYYSTINPFLFLRDLFGTLVVLGIAIAIYRRFIIKIPRLQTNAMDKYAIAIVAVIILSGIFLEGTKITSYSIYQQMEEDYLGLEDESELTALEAYWVKEFGLVSPNLKGPFEDKVIEQGKEIHEASCAMCHSNPKWAFAGYGIAKTINPIARIIDRLNVHTILWYIHYLSCLIGLAYLPFSKMLHIFTSPLSLLANAVMDKEKSDPANIATRQIMELDACTHCGTCTLNCSVGIVFERINNFNILPSEKIASIKKLAAGKDMEDEDFKNIQEGVFLCTNCLRCTVHCPVGINLQDLWFNVREGLLQRGKPDFLILSPLSYYRGLRKDEIEEENYKKPVNQAKEAIIAQWEMIRTPTKALSIASREKELRAKLGLSSQAGTFANCFGCQTCTTVCPVVANYENPKEVLGLLPHQIMHAAGLGLRDLAFGSRMLWDCLTCYQCQEQCPQGVAVTDVLYELKNLAIRNINESCFQNMENKV